MDMETANKLVGRQPKWALRNMQRALEMHTWHNTAEDWRRLEACYVLRRVPLKNRVTE
jgi:hypothetical protein